MAGEPINPYAPPASDVDARPPAGTGAFERPLFSPKQIGWAAFFGSVFAGILLLQANFRTMKRPAAANKTVLLGLLATAAVFTVASLMPRGVSTPVNLGIAYGLYKLAASLQGDEFFAHMVAGGARRSNWLVFGIVAATFVGLMFVVAAVVLASGAEGLAD
jgi:hypothetical protein